MSSVDLQHVVKRFGHFIAVDNISLKVEKAEFLSLLGPSGCGKTTTLRLIAGFLRADEGRIVIGGEDKTHTGPRNRRVGLVFQNYALFPNLSVFENVAFGLRVQKVKEKEIEQRVMELLEMVGLAEKRCGYPKELSGGQQQRVALARALAIRPDVLLLDEPLSALDAKVRNSLRFEIKKIQRESMITTIYVTHDQEEALSISDRVAVMNRGKIEQVGTAWDIYSSPRTLFVADFVGVNNIITVSTCGDGVAHWQDISLKLACLERRPAGTYKIMVRPERMSLGMEHGGYNVLTGVVEGRVFLGPLSRIAVAIGGERLLVDALNSHVASIEPGDPVCLAFSPEDGHVLE